METKYANGRYPGGHEDYTIVNGIYQTDHWHVEDVIEINANVMKLTLISGELTRCIIGAYLPPGDTAGRYMESVAEVYHASKHRVILVGDFNINLRNIASTRLAGLMEGQEGAQQAQQARQAGVAASLACLGLEDVGQRFCQRKKTGVWTWRHPDATCTSVCDYIFAEHTEVAFRHRIRNTKDTSTDHRIVSIQIPTGSLKRHRREFRKRKEFPLKIQPPPTDSDRMFRQIVKYANDERTQRERNPKPPWISASTWALMAEKAHLRRLPGRTTRARRDRYKTLKSAVKRGIKAERKARLEKVASDIEASMAICPKEGYQQMTKWYRHREGRNLPMSQEAMDPTVAAFNELYSEEAPPGEPITIIARGLFETPDGIPTENEIRTAVRRLPKGKACGPTGVRAENLKDWLFCQEDLEERPRDPNSDPPEYAQWKLVTDLMKHIFSTGKASGQFSLASLVLVPKAEQGKFRGIALLEPLYKVIGSIIARRINTAVEYHDGVHGYRPARGCGTAIVETKLQMQLACKCCHQYHQVFLDLSKAYDTIDQSRLLEILSGYGMGPNLRQVLVSAWQDSRLAPKMGNLFGGTIFRNRGVQQGDPLSPTLL